MNSVSVQKKRKGSAIIALVLAIITIFSVFATGMTAFADGDSYSKLKNACRAGEQPNASYGDSRRPIKEKKYKRDGGDYYLYTEITGISNPDSSDIIDEYKYKQLTAGERQEFLKDFVQIAYNWEDHYEKNDIASGGEAITGDTVSDLVSELNNVSGAGSQLMAALMDDMKPDYARANNILKPVSPVVNTVMAVLATLIIMLLGITMALDIAYIVIPAFQLALDGGDDNGSGKGMAKIISQEARSAVKSVSDGGGSGQSGSGNKMAISKYFGMRWKALVVLGICLLYFVGGHIWAFVAWIIDLVSGFLGF